MPFAAKGFFAQLIQLIKQTSAIDIAETVIIQCEYLFLLREETMHCHEMQQSYIILAYFFVISL